MNYNITDIAFEQISGDYYWAKYGDFKVVMDMKTGYINATKLCALAASKNGQPKHFKLWKQNNITKEIINEISLSVGMLADELFTVNTGGQILEARGTYVHPELIPHIACWASPKFAIAVMRIVNKFMVDREINRRNIVISGGQSTEIEARASMRDDITNASLPADRPLQCVYFIRSGEYIKIGYTSDLPKRLSNLQTGNPHQLTVIHTILTRQAEEIEADLHEMFTEYHVSGEWFRLPDDAIARVKELYE